MAIFYYFWMLLNGFSSEWLQLYTSYKARITGSISGVCPECGVAPHSVEHTDVTVMKWDSLTKK